MQAHALNIIKQSTTRHTRFIIYLLPTFAASACEVSHNIELVMLKVLYSTKGRLVPKNFWGRLTAN